MSHVVRQRSASSFARWLEGLSCTSRTRQRPFAANGLRCSLTTQSPCSDQLDQLENALGGHFKSDEAAAAVAACARSRHSPTEVQCQRFGQCIAEEVRRSEVPLSAVRDAARAAVALDQRPQVAAIASAVVEAIISRLGDADSQFILGVIPALVRLQVSVNDSFGRNAYAVAVEALCRQPLSVTFPRREWSLALNGLARASFRDREGMLLHATFRRLELSKLDAWSSMDLSLACNALARLFAGVDMEASSTLSDARASFFSRVGLATKTITSQCSAQDVAHLVGAFAALPKDCREIATSGVRELAPALAWHLNSVSLEGLCAGLVGFVRLRCLDAEIAPIFARAVQRLARSGAQLQPPHLSHLTHAYSAWLDAGSTGLQRREVENAFRTVFCPALVRVANDFQGPKNISFAVASIVRVGIDDDASLRALLALARRLRVAQEAPGDPLAWERFNGPALQSLAESLAQSGGAADEWHQTAIVPLLHSVLDHLLGASCRNESGRLHRLEAWVACRFPRAFLWTPRGVELCQVAGTLALAEGRADHIDLLDVSILLRSMRRLELRDDALMALLLRRVHGLLWGVLEDSTSTSSDLIMGFARLHWDLETASSMLAALDALGYLRECDAFVSCIVWSALVLLKRSSIDSGRELAACFLASWRLLDLDLAPVWAQALAKVLAEKLADASCASSEQLRLAPQLWSELAMLLCKLIASPVDAAQMAQNVQESLQHFLSAGLPLCSRDHCGIVSSATLCALAHSGLPVEGAEVSSILDALRVSARSSETGVENWDEPRYLDAALRRVAAAAEARRQGGLPETSSESFATWPELAEPLSAALAKLSGRRREHLPFRTTQLCDTSVCPRQHRALLSAEDILGSLRESLMPLPPSPSAAAHAATVAAPSGDAAVDAEPRSRS